MMGITGLNPLNLLLMATIGVVRDRAAACSARGPLRAAASSLLLYIPPIVVAGLIGMQHVHEIPSFFYEYGLTFYHRAAVPHHHGREAAGDGRDGADDRRSGGEIARSPERFIIAIAISAWVIVLIQIGFVLFAGRADRRHGDARARAASTRRSASTRTTSAGCTFTPRRCCFSCGPRRGVPGCGCSC